MTRNDWLSGLLGFVLLLTLIFLPAQAAPQPVCYRTKTGIVCVQPGQPGQTQTGGSGITPVKRFRPGT